MPKPKADLASLVIPKGAAAAARPFQPIISAESAPVAPALPLPEQPGAGAERHAVQQDAAPTLRSNAAGPTRAMTLKLPEDVYWRLHELCLSRGRAQGRRVTHQEVMLEGLLALLERER